MYYGHIVNTNPIFGQIQRIGRKGFIVEVYRDGVRYIPIADTLFTKPLVTLYMFILCRITLASEKVFSYLTPSI